MDNAVELFYLENDFETDSNGVMTSLYTVAEHGKYDWIWVECALKRGIEVRIRPATAEETNWAFAKLKQLKAKVVKDTSCASCKTQ